MTIGGCTLNTPCAVERPWQRAHVRAPGRDGTVLAEPPLADASDLAKRNLEQLAASQIAVQGRTLSALREWTRREALAAAESYTCDLLERSGESAASIPQGEHAASDSVPLFVCGHQPALVHPGVWIKNFVADRLAGANGGLGLNLIVDNDALAATAINIPAGTRDAPRLQSVAFDAPRSVQPWEEAAVLDQEVFETFPSRVRQMLAGWNFTSILDEYWPAAVRAAQRGGSLVECLSAARHRFERRWGAANLELPLSRLCRLEPFLWFASHLLAHLPRFHATYNEVLREYRGVYRLRSRTHPVSDLRESGGWLEAPFWVWRQGDARRGRVFARQVEREVHLSDGRNVFAALPLSPNKDACCAVEALKKLDEQGIRIRTRALTTTLFSRLCLADLFIHGLGGAKYDEMTDRLMTRFFRICPPGYLMLSGTALLPLEGHSVDRSDEIRVRSQIRELEYHSDRHLPAVPGAHYLALLEEKERLVAEQHASEARRTTADWNASRPSGYDRLHRLQEINRDLSAFTRTERGHLERELANVRSQLAANAVLRSRDYSACLYPADKLKRFVDYACAFIEP